MSDIEARAREVAERAADIWFGLPYAPDREEARRRMIEEAAKEIVDPILSALRAHGAAVLGELFNECGVSFDDERLRYVEVQVPRVVWEEMRQRAEESGR